jgi:DNA-binding XRE family transcriptional regulator
MIRYGQMNATSDLELIAEGREAAQSGAGEALRKAARLTRAEIAERIPVDPTTVLRWERGTRLPRSEAAMRYALIMRRLASTHAVRRVSTPPIESPSSPPIADPDPSAPGVTPVV